jgi:small subunit ribosomal protein S9
MANKGAYFYANGKRKSAVATVRLYPQGSGNISINGESLKDWSDSDEIFFRIQKPLGLLGVKKEIDLEIITKGGGKVAQADSIVLGISRAFVKKDPTYREQLKTEDLLTRDSRVKERKKPGRARARKSKQWSKR